MTEMTDEKRIEELENILLSYAFTISEKQIVTKMTENNATVKDYVLALADGLMYGNWPWVNHSKPKCWYTHNSIQHCPVCGVIE